MLAWRRLDGRSITCSNSILREDGWPPRVEHDRHICGLFPRAGWIRLLREAGFRPEITRDQYERDGFLVSFWDVVDHDPHRADPDTGGRSLRELHEALASLPEELPPFHRLDEISALLGLLRPSELISQDEIDGLRAVLALLAARPLPPLRPVHGDAHLGNVLWSPDGPRWTDFENLCAGPIEYDLACTSWRRGRSQRAST